MPIPPNLTPETAIEITTLPFTTNQNVHDAGVTYDVWYKYTGQPGDTMIGVWGFGGTVGTGYRPRLFVSNPNDPTTFMFSCGSNRAGQVFVNVGSTYYFKFDISSTTINPANLAISVLRFTEITPIPIGSILINDDTTAFPAAILGTVINAEPLKFIPNIHAGELGSILDNGIFMLDSTEFTTVRIYRPDFSLIAEPSFSPILGVTTNKTNMFYILDASANPARVRKIASDGSTVGDVVANITPATGLVGNLEYPAISPDESIFYYREYPGIDAQKIKRHNLLTDTPMSNLNDGIATYSQQNREMLVLKDGTIINSYKKIGVASDYIVQRFNPDGSEASRYTSPGSYSQAGTMRLAHAIDDPASFWLWIEPATGISRFLNIRVNDGAILTNIVGYQYEVGEYFVGETATPLSRFGHSQSCPFLILRKALPLEPEGPTIIPGAGIYQIVPGKRNDTLYETGDVKIPNPRATTTYIGS